MNPASLLSPEAWAIQTFSAVQLGDQRRTDRVVRMAAAMAAEPNASLPKQMRQRNELYAAYRLLGNEEVTHTALLEPHWQDSRQATHGRARVLLVQDTTDLNYSQHAETSGLGSIGRSKKGHGFLLQTVLALDPMTHEVLGMVYQEPFVRKDARHPGKRGPSDAIGSANRRSGNGRCMRSDARQALGSGCMWAIAIAIFSPSGSNVSKSSVPSWCELLKTVGSRRSILSKRMPKELR